MRIGSALVFLVVSWIGLGYLFADNINTHQDLTQVQQQLNQVVQERNVLQSQLQSLNSENATLRDENAQLIEQTSRLQEQTKLLQSENAKLEQQYSDLQVQFDKAKNLTAYFYNFVETLRQAPLLALVIPALPTSLVAGYVVYQSGKRHYGQTIEKHERPNRIFTINVTRDEMREIERTRRGLSVNC